MQTHNKCYQQLTQEPRYQISALRKTGMTLRGIAKEVGIHFSTVSRELCRNKTEGGYDPVIAHQLSKTRKTKATKANIPVCSCTAELIGRFRVYRCHMTTPNPVDANSPRR